ncbi:MAG: nucleoside triphosphate pyrophosphohydrolase [Firmicutes bacterium]|nr:nucleoside triphosphate pyrophosphohydrolase [Bacillota bacterium]
MTAKITIVGLGPGGKDSLPPVNLNILREADRLFLRTTVHPVVEWLKERQVAFASFDAYYESGTDFNQVYRAIADHVLAAAQTGPVVYAVPGHPLVAETTVEMIIGAAGGLGLAVDIVPAMSFLDAVYAALRIDPVQGMQIADGLRLDEQPINPAVGAIVVQVYSRLAAGDIKLALLERYPAEHQVTMIQAAGVPGLERVARMPLYQIDRVDWVDHLTSLYLPPLTGAAQTCRYPLDELVTIMARLRSDNGCPWDREQDHHTLTRYLLEEAYEVLETIQEEDMYKLCEELGDLLLQIVFHAQIAGERGYFDVNDVVAGVSRKMVRRHPHVFGELHLENSDQVLTTWEEIKQRERGGDAGKNRSILDGAPRGLPALLHAYKIQAKAAQVGFDWPDYRGALLKLQEELAEWREALQNGNRECLQEETGDILFAMVNVARMFEIDPELALAATNSKFLRRFRYIEDQAAAKGLILTAMTLEEMDFLWEQAKKEEK